MAFDVTGTRIFLGARFRDYAGTLVACVAFAVCPSAQTPALDLHTRLQAREVVEAHLKSFATKNSEREALVRQRLAQAGCRGKNLFEQAVDDHGNYDNDEDRSNRNADELRLDRSLPPNVICVLPGSSRHVIVVGAHTDHVERGDGVVDNWTGAALLSALLYSLSAQPRHHTFVFVGFSAEEQGLLGSRYYVDHMTREQSTRVDAMVNVDSLGLGPTEVWASHADSGLLDALERVAKANKLPLTTMNPPNGASADSESFARHHIPRITLHSVTEQTWAILHSPDDKIGAINMSDYLESYRLIAEYLAYLDEVLKS